MTGPQEAHSEQMGRRTTCISIALLLLSMAFVIARTSRDALFMQESGIFDLPVAYIGIAILSMPVAILMLTMMRYAGARRVRVATPLATGVVLLIYQRVAQPGGGPLMTFFFMLIPLIFGVLFSVVWLLGAELLEAASHTARVRAYSTIGAATIAGGALGSALARILASGTTPETLLGFASLLVGAATLVIICTQRWFPASVPHHANSSVEPLKPRHIVRFLQQPYTGLLLGISMLASLVGVLVEFQFYLAAATSGQDGPEQVTFFASFYFFLHTMALFVQLLVMPRLQHRYGIAGSLLVLPGALLGGTLALVGSASLFMRSLLRVTEGGLKSSIHRANWEQTYLPLDRATRVIAKLLVDGAGARVAEGLGAIIIVVWLRLAVQKGAIIGGDTRWITWLLLVTILMWLVLTRFLGRNLTLQGFSKEAISEMRAELSIPDS